MNRLLSIALVCLLQVSLAVASTFNLRVEVTPSGAASLNTSGGTYEEGSSIYLRTYANTGFVFKGWYEGETLLSSSTSFNYTMPSKDVLVQARYEYDPAVPDNPSMPDTTTYYSLTATVSPIGAGSLNTYSGKYAAGASVYMRSYVNTGYQFVGWQNNVGETISTSSSFNYTMPRSDANLTALYIYDPSVPANPDSMATRYTVTIACKPVGGGTFNTTSATAEEGGNVHLYAYTNTGYRFLYWENEAGEVVSTAQKFYYIMPHGNSKLYGIFEYDPAVPGNPNKNSWNKELGEVIVDDFSPGSLGGAVSAAISGSNRSDVAMITVAGRMNDNDFGIANDYTNCTLLDLSRVTGVTAVPSYAFDYTNLESVYLPATIENIGYRAFYDCKQLSSLIVYAMTPPVLESQVFTNVPEGLIVYVPASSINQYQDADGWKDFTILPIQEDIRSISISLPKGTDATDYAQMWLELTNTKSGQRMHYVMTDRRTYTFANIIRSTSWNVTLRNERGDIFGQIDNVEVKDDDVSVTFSSLSKPQSVVLSVLTPDGQDVTALTHVTWTDVQGNYLAQGVSLTGLPISYQTTYRVVLSQELAMTYDTPQPVDYVLTDGNNRITCQLNAIPQVKISGKVKDASTGLPLSGAFISASQMFGGKYSKTLNAKTDANGLFTFDIANVPTSFAFAASDYVSQAVKCDSLLTGVGEVTLPDVSLKTITGATITLGFTYTSCDGETQNWYSDYQNVGYELFNVTKNQTISQYNVQYPLIVLLEDITDGDVLRLTATSRTNAFMPVVATATIAEQKAEATFAIVELGKIQSSFTSTGNAAVVGSLYDSAGKLLKTYNYSEASLTISDLADGNYTLVSMGSSRLFNTIYDLSQLPQTGLVVETDYVQNSVEVKSGQVSAISISEVPTLDESKLYYTGDNTSFTVNKPSIVAGNYLTLTGRIDFKPAYATNVSNVQMVVDLPESCEFVENSVMVGNSTSSYTMNGNQITIPMDRYTDRVRFCIIPTLGGEYAPSAFVQFDLNGETVTQPIGSANYTAKDLSISVPSTVAKTAIPVSGTAIGTSSVEIYDNDVLIGQTTSLANGTWATICELNKPYNLSTHNIFAKVTTKSGIGLVSETENCLYDKNAIEVNTVTMINTAHTSANLDLYDYITVFDFQNPETSLPPYWYWPNYPDFTFIVDFTRNDTTVISNVVIKAFTEKKNWISIRATFDQKRNNWVAVHRFDNNDLPIGVRVKFDAITPPVIDTKELISLQDSVNVLKSDLSEVKDDISGVISTINTEIDSEKPDTAKIEELIMGLGMPLSIGVVQDSLDNLGEEQLSEYVRTLCEQTKTFVNAQNQNLNTILEDYKSQSQFKFEYLGKQYTVEVSEPYSIDVTTLLEDGFKLIQTTLEYLVYEKYSDSKYIRIDLMKNICVTMSVSSIQNAKKRAITKEDLASICASIMDAISSLDWTKGKMNDFVIWFSFEKDKAFKAFAAQDQLVADALKAVEKKMATASGFQYLKLVEDRMALLAQRAALTAQWKIIAESMQATIKCVGAAIGGITNIVLCLKTEYDNCVKIAKLKVPDCLYDFVPSIAYAYESEIDGLFNYVRNWALWTIGRCAVYMAGDVILSESVVLPIALTLIECAAEIYYAKNKQKEFDNMYSSLKIRMKNSRREYCKNDDDDDDDDDDDPEPQTKPVRDPSGYVYEGVTSNRIEGVIATAYYKETVEDMYGDLHDIITKWDAEEYAQENPLFTDANGMYAWDVPQGLWQVKFEKEGYETAYSEWLPVPPPQLDVNIAMKQNRQPEVKAARAYEDAVEVEFDKYMMPELLTAENIMVMQNGTAVEGTVELLNEEVSYEGEAETFASKIRFNAAQPFTEQEITLMVNNRVKSYAGIRMQDNYEQTFTIEQEIKQIVSDSVVTVGYGNASTIVVSVLPASASKGKTLIVKSSSPMILSVEAEQVTIGDDGKAEITVSGELPGTAALTFSVEGTDKTAMTIFNVEQSAIKTVATPKANIASGTVVEKGTAITLTCETEGATIYYTLDGSCPCDNTDARKVYDGTPIIISETMTIKVMAAAPDMYESEVAEFYYIVDGTGIDDISINEQIQIYPLPIRNKLNISACGKTIKNVIVSSMNGVVVASSGKPATIVTLDVSTIPTGIYIVNIQTGGSSYSRKVLKVK